MEYALIGFVLGTIAAALSLVALAGSGWALLQSRGPRVAQLERAMGSSVSSLVNRIEVSESTVRSLVEEASESFERAESARKRASAVRSRADQVVVAEPPPPPQLVTRQDVLADVEKRLGGRGA